MPLFIDDYGIHVYVNSNKMRLTGYNPKNGTTLSYPKIILERYLNRKINDNEEVHHIDGNPLNNSIENLTIITKDEHLKYHGNLNKKYHDKILICPVCGKEFLWTAKNQSNRARKHSINKYKVDPCCSKHCLAVLSNKIHKEMRKNDNN